MASVEEIADKIEDFLADRISLEDFEDWSAEYAWNIHRRADLQTQGLARKIRSVMNAFDENPSDAALKRELAAAILPFVRDSTRAVHVVSGKPLGRALTASSASSFYSVQASQPAQL